MGGVSDVGSAKQLCESALRADVHTQVTHHEVGEVRATGPADFAAGGGKGVPLSSKDRRRNFRLGVINGAIFRIGDVFIDTEMVLTWFLAQLGTSNLLIGLVSPIRFGGSFLLQMLVSGYMERKPYKLPFYRTISIFRSSVLLLFALAVALIPLSSPWLTLAFFIVLTLFSLGAGLVNIPFMDVVGKVVPAQRRGAFFGQRMFWGGILALAGSSVVGFLLTEPYGLHFPRNVSVMFVLAALFFGFTAWSWILVKEPPSPVVEGIRPSSGRSGPKRAALSERSGRRQLDRGLSILKEDGLYRRYAIVRFALAVADWSVPFYIVYARNTLGIAAGMVGLYLGVRTVAMILSNLVWGRVSDGQGNRKLINITTLVGLMTPAIVLLTGVIQRSVPDATGWLGYAFAAVFLTAGAYSSGSGIGIINYLLDIAPESQRPLYLAFNNTLFGLVRFTGMAGGLIVDSAGFETLLGISLAAYVVAFLLSLTMGEPRSAVS